MMHRTATITTLVLRQTARQRTLATAAAAPQHTAVTQQQPPFAASGPTHNNNSNSNSSDTSLKKHLQQVSRAIETVILEKEAAKATTTESNGTTTHSLESSSSWKTFDVSGRIGREFVAFCWNTVGICTIVLLLARSIHGTPSLTKCSFALHILSIYSFIHSQTTTIHPNDRRWPTKMPSRACKTC